MGTWSTWTIGSCSKECNGGQQLKTRVCQTGSSCPGESSETLDCNTSPCQNIEHLNYGNNEKESWTVNANCAPVKVTSSKFETESGYDFLSIDGTAYSGSDPIDKVVQKDTFNITFTSDGSTTKGGFLLDWKCITG